MYSTNSILNSLPTSSDIVFRNHCNFSDLKQTLQKNSPSPFNGSRFFLPNVRCDHFQQPQAKDVDFTKKHFKCQIMTQDPPLSSLHNYIMPIPGLPGVPGPGRGTLLLEAGCGGV